MVDQTPRPEADKKPESDQDEGKKTPPVAIAGGDEPAKQNTENAEAQAKPPQPSELSQEPPIAPPIPTPLLIRHDRYDWSHLSVLILTLIAASVAAYEAGRLADLTEQLIKDGQETSKQQAELTRESNKLNRDTLIAGSRAWVGPVSVKIDGPVEAGKPIKTITSIRNTGREPGKNFRSIFEPIFTTEDEDNKGILSQKITTSRQFCFSTPSLPFGQVIYPTVGFGSGFEFTTTFAKDTIDDSVISGEKILVVLGCVAYDTFEITRHSSFCYFFKSGTTRPENLNICLGGSAAD
jgi:hypothetical protein